METILVLVAYEAVVLTKTVVVLAVLGGLAKSGKPKS